MNASDTDLKTSDAGSLSPAPSGIAGKYGALLFDMDGTLLSSIKAAERIWGAWAARQGLDVDAFLKTIHGARAIDTIRQLALPGIDAEREAQEITRAEIADIDGVVEIPGAIRFLLSLPSDKWAIVTSAPKALAMRRLQAAGIPLPAVLITSEDVERGKPQPDCYLLAAQKLGVSANDCLIFEDAAAGIAAGETAGATVVVVTSTHEHKIETTHATICNYEELFAEVDANGLMHIKAH